MYAEPICRIKKRAKRKKFVPHIHRFEFHHYDNLNRQYVYFCSCGKREVVWVNSRLVDQLRVQIRREDGYECDRLRKMIDDLRNPA